MEKQLKCVVLLSLKEMALRMVAALVWNDCDILAPFLKIRHDELVEIEDTMEEWRETIEPKIKDEVLKLDLPILLKKQMIDIVRPIGLQIRIWIYFQDYYLSKDEKISLPNLVKIFWTTEGMINYRRTAEELVRCDAFNVVQCYKLACINCLENYIPLLFEKLSEERKKRFLRAGIRDPELELCWPYIIRGELSELDYLWKNSDRNLTSFNQWAFERSVEDGNKEATEFFFQKLTYAEREVSLMTTVEAALEDTRIHSFYPLYGFRFRKERLSDVLCYLLALMAPEQQMEILKKHPSGVLLIFLSWPWPDLFSENAGLFWDFLPLSGCYDMLQNMVDRFKISSNPFFPKLFQNFFILSPLDFKKFFVEEDVETSLSPASIFLSAFADSDDSESIEVIFRNLDATDRVKLVFQHFVLEFFWISMWKDKWHMVEVCLREAMLSREDKERLKDEFTEYLERNRFNEYENKKIKRFFDFLDETDETPDNSPEQ